MSDYCTVADIEVLLQLSFSTSSLPTTAQVEREIDQVTKELDFTMKSVGISTQPTDTTILARLRNACSYGAACRVGMGGFTNNNGVQDTQPGHYCDKYQAVLDDIKDSPEMYGLVTGDETIFVNSDVIDGTRSESSVTDQFFDGGSFKY